MPVGHTVITMQLPLTTTDSEPAVSCDTIGDALKRVEKTYR